MKKSFLLFLYKRKEKIKISMRKFEVYESSVKGRRETNEDAHNIEINIQNQDPTKNPINLFGIYDGHGGPLISQFLKQLIPKYYMNINCGMPNEISHSEVFRQIQRQIVNLDEEIGYKMGSTCLLNLMYKLNKEIYLMVVNLGDCRLNIGYLDGKVQQITRDHKPNDIDEKARIKALGGKIYLDEEKVYRIGDLSVSRSFGDADNAPYISSQPDTHHIKLSPDIKWIIMACDGLWDSLSNEEVIKILNEAETEAEANIETKDKTTNLASILIKKALDARSIDNIPLTYDNISIIIIKITQI